MAKQASLLILILLVLSNVVIAQQALEDSLTQKLETLSEDDSMYVETANRLASVVSRTNPFLSREYAERALPVAQRKGDKLGEALALRTIGNYYMTRGAPDSAIILYDESLIIFREIDDQRGVAMMVAGLGNFHAINDQFDEAIVYFLEALEYYLEVESYNSVGIMYNNIANLYLEQTLFEQAIKNYKSSLQYYERTENKRQLALPLRNIGNAFKELGMYDSALVYLDRGLENAKEYKNNRSISSITSMKAHIYREREEYETAIEYYNIAEELMRQIGNVRELVEINYYYGLMYLRMGEPELAKPYAEIVIDSFENGDMGLVRLKRETYGLLAQIEASMGNFEDAYEHSLVYTTLDDSIRNTENLETIASLQLQFEAEKETAIAEIEIAYETERKEQEIVLLEAENEAAQLRIAVILSLSIFLIITILIVVWLRSRFKEEQKKLRINAIQQELDNYGILIAEKDSFNRQLISTLKEIGADLKTTKSKKELTSVIDSLGRNMNLNENEDLLFQRIEQINSGFFVELKKRFGSLSKSEKRLASLVHMDLSNKQISSILHINPRSVNQAKYRLKKKLGLEAEENLIEFLNSMEPK